MFNNAKHKQHHFSSAGSKQYCKSKNWIRYNNECLWIFFHSSVLFNVKIILYYQVPWSHLTLYVLPHATIFFTTEMWHGHRNLNTNVICLLEKPGTSYQARQHHTPGYRNPTKPIFESSFIDSIFGIVWFYGHENSLWYDHNVNFLHLFLYATNVRFAPT
jgi:hypothetical protein